MINSEIFILWRNTFATVLRDVGKINISDVILNEPGKFTAEEYEIMKTHTRIGGELVEIFFNIRPEVEEYL